MLSEFTLGMIYGVFLVFAGHGLAIIANYLRNGKKN